jgi:hypothetical protein
MNCENCGTHIKRGELRLFRERDATGVTIRKWWLCRACFRLLAGLDTATALELVKLGDGEECEND